VNRSISTYIVVVTATGLFGVACGSSGVASHTVTQLAAPASFNAAHLVHGSGGVYIATENAVLRDTGSAVSSSGPLPMTAEEQSLSLVAGSPGIDVALSGQNINIYRSFDAGKSWARGDPIDASNIVPDGFTAVTAAANATVAVVAAQEASSSNFSFGDSFVSKGGGAWRHAQLPSGGAVAEAGGNFWLVGGPAGDRLFVSSDGLSWSDVTPSKTDATQLTVSSPVEGNGSVVVPVTSRSGGSSTVTFYTTNDGGNSWSNSAAVTISANTEAGVAMPVAVAGDSWLVAQPDGKKLYVGNVSGGEPSTVTTSGLPAGVVQIGFLNKTQGAAIVDTTSCPNGKQSCASAAQIYYTSNGGTTWKAY
jgi:hypothetical protein